MQMVKYLNFLDFLAIGLAGCAILFECVGWTIPGMVIALTALVIGAISLKRGHATRTVRILPLPLLQESGEDSALFTYKYVIFDIESSGILPHKDELLRIGAKKITNGQIMHGIDFDERAQDALAAAGQAFHAFSEGAVLVGHNAALKLAFLKFHSDEIGVDFDCPVLDLTLLSSILFGPDAPHDTDSICARLGIDTAAAGRKLALAKARRNSVIFETMLPYLHAKGLDNLEQLQAACQEQAELLNAR